MGLNPKQTLFIKYYLISQNATQAAKKAGYSKKTAHSIGPRLLENVEVKKALNAQMKSTTDKLDITVERIAKRIAWIAFEDDHFTKKSDMLKALELLGRYKGMFNDKLDINNLNPNPPQVIITLPSNKREPNK